MKKIIDTILPILFLYFIISCGNSVVEPEEPNYEPGRRDYTWTADTIKRIMFISIRFGD